MFRATVLAAALVTGAGCSSGTTPPTATPNSDSTAPHAVSPSSIRIGMTGELNAMPSLASLGDRVVLVWTGTKDGAMNVYSAVSDDRGATFNVQRRVNDQPGDVSANVEQPPRVAMSSSGITVVWSSKKTGTSAIRLARSRDGGRSFSPAVTIHNQPLKGARGWESIAAAADGSVRVAWLDGRNNPGTARAAPMDHARMDHSGSPRQDVYEAIIRDEGPITETLVASNVCFCCKTAVAVTAGGRVIAAWRHIFPGSLRDIAMAISTDQGAHFGGFSRVSEDKWEIAGCPEDGPALAVDAGSVAHVVWPTVVSAPQTQKAVFYASTKDGRVFTPRVRLSGAEQDEAAHPQIAVRRDGAVAVVWDEPHGDVRQVLMRTASGGQFEKAIVLSSVNSGDHPVIVPVADGLMAAWTTNRPISAVELQRIGVSAPPVKPAEMREFSFRGTVETVDPQAGTVTVNGENVEGWMGAMTMKYEVGNMEELSRLKAGDQITATVRSDDFQHLYGVAIAH